MKNVLNVFLYIQDSLALSARHYSGIGSEYINEAVKAGAGLKIVHPHKPILLWLSFL